MALSGRHYVVRSSVQVDYKLNYLYLKINAYFYIILFYILQFTVQHFTIIKNEL